MPKVLVANRGEIAIRIFRSAAELGWNTVAVYTGNDSSHVCFAEEVVKLDSVADFLDVDAIVKVAVRNTQCTHVHPGYGFLSENPALPLALAAMPGFMVFIGPSPDALKVSSDKMLSRDLANSLGVNIAAGIRVSSTADVKNFAKSIGFPMMIKALDGGGGRGIRVVESEGGDVQALPRRKSIQANFREKGSDGSGLETHRNSDYWRWYTREPLMGKRVQCSTKSAPSRLPRSAIQPLLDASLKSANHLKYKGLGTFEYLVNTQDWVFLKINPCIQVEHTITEEISDTDLVRAQLLLFTPNATLDFVQLSAQPPLPSSYSIQLRLTAEDPTRGFQLSPGPVYPGDLSWPAGKVGVVLGEGMLVCVFGKVFQK